MKKNLGKRKNFLSGTNLMRDPKSKIDMEYFNTRKRKRVYRVFPLSIGPNLIFGNTYIKKRWYCSIIFCPMRKLVEDGMLIDLNDSRLKIFPGEKVLEKQVRFRTLGCYP